MTLQPATIVHFNLVDRPIWVWWWSALQEEEVADLYSWSGTEKLRRTANESVNIYLAW